MGLFDWLKRKDAGDPSTTTYTVTTHSVSVDAGVDGAVHPVDGVDLQDPERRAAIEQIEHLARELLTTGGGLGTEGGSNVTASTTVVVDGQTVSPDDPRALEAIRKAADKLRRQGLGELAVDLEARFSAAPAAAAGAQSPVAGPAPSDGSQPMPAAGEAHPAETAPTAGSASAPPGDDDLVMAPSAPAPPEPPAPPS